MTLSDLLSLMIYLVMTVSLGNMFLHLVVAQKLLRNWAVSYLAGQLLWLFLFLLATYLAIPAIMLVWVVGSLAIMFSGVIAWRDRHNFLHGIFAFLLVLIVCAISFPQLFYTVFRVPLFEWDARSIWFFHAKSIWVNDGIHAAFFTNPDYTWWSHMDYPLLLPTQAAVIGLLRGEWSEMAVKSYLIFNFIAYLWLLQRILVQRGWHKIVAWMFAIPLMGIALPAYINGYADNHYAMPLLLALLLAFCATPRDGSWALAGLLALFALNIKNEATIYLLMGGAMWFLLMKLNLLKRDAMGASSRRSRWGIALLGLLPFLLWSLFKAIHSIEGDLHLGSKLMQPNACLILCLERTPHILSAIGIVHLKMYSHVLLCLIGALYVWRYLLQRKQMITASAIVLEERLLWGLLVIVHLMILAVYVLTPYDVTWHLDSSLDRLLLLPVLIIVALIVCAAEKIMEIGCSGDRQEDKRSS